MVLSGIFFLSHAIGVCQGHSAEVEHLLELQYCWQVELGSCEVLRTRSAHNVRKIFEGHIELFLG